MLNVDVFSYCQSPMLLLCDIPVSKLYFKSKMICMMADYMIYPEEKKKRILTLTLGISTIINKINIYTYSKVKDQQILDKN
jgi:hypothetical protein